MKIQVRRAYENNLKHISVDIPLYQITGLTGVSGSGKSTLLKNVLAASGNADYTRIQTKTVRDALRISDFVKAEDVSNMPLPIFIAAKNVVSNSISTVSTVSGIQEILRNLFTGFGEIHCPVCGTVVPSGIPADAVFSAELMYDDRYEAALTHIRKRGRVLSESFFDRKSRPVKPGAKSAALALVRFSLQRPSDHAIQELHKQFGCHILISDSRGEYDPLSAIRCSCGRILPRIARSRLSFATPFEEGGGACRRCGGSGSVVSISRDMLIEDMENSIFQGGIRFLTKKGLAHTTVTERFIQAAADLYGIDTGEPLGRIPEEKLEKLFYGSEDIITFQDRVGGKKNQAFQGIAAYLCQSYAQGKGGAALAGCCVQQPCPECGGLRLDRETDCFVLFGKTISEIFSMTLTELRDWAAETQAPEEAGIYLNRLRRKTDYFCRVSCGHLSLGRSSNTLSGGELQRLRICAMLNSSVDRLCYLLDEPSSGLHASEVECLGALLRELCARGNTVIMVEHNRSLLRFCDHIVDLGPAGGSAGGNLLFSDKLSRVDRYDTATAALLSGKTDVPLPALTAAQGSCTHWLTFAGLTQNNLKNITVRIPSGRFSVICGVSGSGKSTLLRDVILEGVGKDPEMFGVCGVSFLGQSGGGMPATSTVVTLLKLSDHIAKIFSAASSLSRNCFMPNAKDGKCPACDGKGVLFSESGETVGVCDVCHGKCYSPEVLSVRVHGINIDELLNTPLDQLGALTDDKKMARLSFVCGLLGIGYLTLSRKSKSLSTGELQRIRLAYSLSNSKENGQLYLLDEPSKGLHNKDAGKLAEAIHLLVDAGNTVIAVEHNAHLIAGCDYLVELGGTGRNGGHLLYSGAPSRLSNTPTAELLRRGPEGPRPALFMDEPPVPSLPVLPNSEPEQMREIARRTVEEYLSVAIPNNIFFSRAYSARQVQNIPCLQLIDFSERIRYDISLYAALGIRESVIACVCASNPEDSGMLRYVVHDESPTGKCGRCGGSGVVTLVDESFFIEDGALAKACVRFLQNSTCYKDVAKVLRSDHGLHITKPLAEMDADERQVLFWGWPTPLKTAGRQMTWPGIIAAFLRDHRHYSDSMAEPVYDGRRKELCPVCGGELLRPEYRGLRLLGVSYGELLIRPVGELNRRVDARPYQIPAAERVVRILSLLVEAGLEDLTLGQTLAQLDRCGAALVRWISMYVNRTADIGIIADHWDDLDQKAIAFLERTAADWRKTNPVWLI